jgi:(E)-4-hydroxy-3-methylbut-2-enyl-diphosphate synthase
MTNTRTEDVRSTVRQIRRLEKAGCEIVRVAVPTAEAAKAISEIKKEIRIPLVADIHYDYRLALRAIERGADKVRINPGNIGAGERVECILNAAKERQVPIRIGVNSGSLEKALLRRFGGVTAEALVESALSHVWICEEAGFEDLVVSIKAPDVPLSIQTNRLLAEKVPYPIHLGVTESGTLRTGTIRSAVGIGALLADGIGDTIRVSLTGDPVDEVHAGYEILKSLHLRRKGITVVSCPTCGRTHGDLIAMAEKIERALSRLDKPITVAVMGCEVNGPGEARMADLGVAFGKKLALLFKRGKPVRRIRFEDIVRTVAEEANRWPD